jgi:protease YdgD
MRRLFPGLLLAALATSPGQAETPLKRLTLRQDLLGWEAVGRIEVGEQGYCTGTLIAPDLVLTAAHCLYGQGSAPVAPSAMRFRAGLRDGETVAESSVARAIAHPEYRHQSRDAMVRVRYDAALLVLAAPIPAATAAPFPPARLSAGARGLSVVSYGRGRDEAPSWEHDCRVTGRAQGLLAFDCNATFGSSGAPVFAPGASGRPAIVALVSSGVDGKRIALGMELPAIVADLRAALRTRITGALPAAPATPARLSGSGAQGSARFVRPPAAP